MAKTIKFNLICNDYPIRNIEDLQNNFSIEDILEYYHNGLLKRWLDVRGYSDYLDKVINIDSVNDKDIIINLINIFNIESDDKKITEHISILDYIDERKKLLKEYKDINYKVNDIINDYHKGYNSIIDNIISNNNDMAKIKANIQEIETNYMGLYELNYYELYNLLEEKAPMAIFAILMNENLKKFYMDDNKSSQGTIKIYKKILTLISNKNELKEILGEELKIFKGDTEAYWKDIEPKDKKFIVINMEKGNYIRNAGTFGEEISNKEVDGKFLILDGIDYKSNNNLDELLYMEV